MPLAFAVHCELEAIHPEKEAGIGGKASNPPAPDPKSKVLRLSVHVSVAAVAVRVLAAATE